jgi:N-acetylglutamate synthase-like GNAT family acetyltransferase
MRTAPSPDREWLSVLKWTLRHSLKPGDIGYLTYLHGTVYAREYGYDTTFEAYVAGGLAEFAESFDPKKDRIWLVEAKHRIVGSIAVVGRSRRRAQLRWFFVHPDYREHGIGRTLLQDALQFSKKRKYKTVYLWTTSELDTARHLYQDLGFKKTHEKEHRIWGKTIKEERYNMQL